MICPHCGFSRLERDARCPQCEAEAAWPPAPLERPSVPAAAADPVNEALHLGWRLLLLGAFCAPPVFLPLAAWQGWEANRRSEAGAGNLLLMLCAGAAAFWLGATLLWLRFGSGL